MRICLVLLAIATLAWRPARCDANDATGVWAGHWTRAGDTLRVVMRIERDPGTGALRGSFDSDELRVAGIPLADVAVEGQAVAFRIVGDRTTSRFDGRLQGDRLAGTFTEAGSAGTFAFARATAPPPAFHEEEVAFESAGVKLAGSLLLPAEPRPAPAVVFVHGSGAEGRWASRFLATQLVGRGFAALIFDKRGVGGSSGDWRMAGPDELAGDAAAAVDFLRSHPAIDSTRIGLHGHSQGGTLAPMMAVRSGRVAFIIASAAASAPFDSIEVFSLFNSARDSLRTPADSLAVADYVREVVAVAYHGRPRARLDSLATAYRDRPWFFPLPAADHHYWAFSRRLSDYDPLHWWAQVHVPVLLIYGGADERVPAEESAARIAERLTSILNHRVTRRIYPGADHTFRLPPGPGGWAKTAPRYLQDLLDWVQAVTWRGAGRRR